MFVVNAGEDFGGNFVRFEKMMEVGSGVILAAFAVAFGIERSKVFFELGVFDIDSAV